jgi:hypothetical protein
MPPADWLKTVLVESAVSTLSTGLAKYFFPDNLLQWAEANRKVRMQCESLPEIDPRLLQRS